MNLRSRNRLFVLVFLVGTIAFTGLMTFYYGPRMMALRDSVEDGKLLFKCQQIVDGNTIKLQLRSWKRPNTNAVVRVTLAGLNTPPAGKAEDAAVREWAEQNGVTPALAATMGKSAEQALRAFVRKQNLIIERADGLRVSSILEAGTPVHIFVSGSHVNVKQLKHGLALHDAASAQIHRELYAAMEAEARASRQGLWGDGGKSTTP